MAERDGQRGDSAFGTIRPGTLTALLQEIAAAPREAQGAAWESVLRPGVVVGRFELLRDERRPAPAKSSPTPAIAVLPFADMSPGKDQEYFADGVAEEIPNALTHVKGLRVVGRTSSFSFKGKGEDLKAIGQKLGVAHVPSRTRSPRSMPGWGTSIRPSPGSSAPSRNGTPASTG